jgi:hypothetical protein
MEQTFAGYRISSHGISKQGALEFLDRAMRNGNPRIDGLAWLGNTTWRHLFLLDWTTPLTPDLKMFMAWNELNHLCITRPYTEQSTVQIRLKCRQ